MKFDLCFPLVDLGNDAAPHYKAMASEMIRSARKAFKDHEMRVVQLTDNRGIHHPDADGVFAMDTQCQPEQLCQFRGYMTAEYAIKNPSSKIMFCDVDLIFSNDSAANAMFEHPRKIHLIQREWACMPFNNGFVMTEGHGEFWGLYQSIIKSYPLEICSWWVDQLAMSQAVPMYGQGFIFYDMEKWLPAPDEAPLEPLKGFAAHFKGPRKDLMIKYARMIDEGDAWIEAMRPKVPRPHPVADNPHTGWKVTDDNIMPQVDHMRAYRIPEGNGRTGDAADLGSVKPHVGWKA